MNNTALRCGATIHAAGEWHGTLTSQKRTDVGAASDAPRMRRTWKPRSWRPCTKRTCPQSSPTHTERPVSWASPKTRARGPRRASRSGTMRSTSIVPCRRPARPDKPQGWNTQIPELLISPFTQQDYDQVGECVSAIAPIEARGMKVVTRIELAAALLASACDHAYISGQEDAGRRTQSLRADGGIGPAACSGDLRTGARLTRGA